MHKLASLEFTWPLLAQVSIPMWALVHLPVVVTVTTAAFTPRVSASRICTGLSANWEADGHRSDGAQQLADRCFGRE